MKLSKNSEGFAWF